MALNIAYNQDYTYLASRNVINEAAHAILKNAELKNGIDASNLSILGLDFVLKNAKNTSISNECLQMTLDANLKETLHFLNSEASKRILNTKNSLQKVETVQSTEKESLSSYQWYYGELLELFDYEIDDETVNIFAV